LDGAVASAVDSHLLSKVCSLLLQDYCGLSTSSQDWIMM
jgi:hypothetical protein